MRKKAYEPYKKLLTNAELASIYDFLMGNITQSELQQEVKRARTNVYYYLGRAFDYWLDTGTVTFKEIHSQEDLGGKKDEEVLENE